MKQDQNNNSSKTEKASKRSANSGEESRQLSPSVSDNTSGDVELVVTGDGPTKEKATLSALRSALEQVYGTMVSSNTKILNDELVKDEIVSISTGIVKKYTYLSEKEVGGRFYVVVKALVTPQKLITYAKQKGASTELAGATFAANVRIQKLNEENKRIASRNITEMQRNILPKCLDFSIIEIKEPQHYHWDPDDVFWVKFKLRVCLNSNAKIIQDLEKDKPTYNSGNVEQTLKTIFCQFKIEDDINEYIPLFKTRYNQNREAEYTLSFTKRSKDNASNSIYVQMETGGGYIRAVCNDVTYFMCDSKGEISDVYRVYPKDNFITFNNVHWKDATPNRPIVTIPMRIRYTLNDLDRITGIRVTPIK
ncbi:MAG: LPP20 family lipoprotein [Paludibacteraceae bacterium]|nr:LPP20 family lipoprotein [Paludibacteraceae bacterium]